VFQQFCVTQFYLCWLVLECYVHRMSLRFYSLKLEYGSLSLTTAFEKIIKRANSDGHEAPKLLHTDKGTEFKNKPFNNMLRRHNIKLYHTESEEKSAIIERYHRTLNEKLKVKFQVRQSHKWYDILQEVTDEYNQHDYHHTIKMRPVEVNKDNEADLLKMYIEREHKIRKNSKFDLGDRVRITTKKDVWSTFVNELPEIENLEIGRYISLSDAVNIQLHGFSDASELGFAGCVYLRTENPQGSIYVNLLIAKSRVAPLKRITIPRLELCGAHILAKLLHYCVDQLSDRYKIDSVTAWSDSTVALSWIHTPSHRLKLYVANRVAQIQELTPSCIWKHISTLENPADVASRGLTPSLLIHNKLWWSGPTWLKSSSDSWPQPSSHLPEEELPEIKTTTLNLLTIAEDQDLKFINKFSSWTKLLHVMGYVLRFISCLKTKQRITHSLTLEELEVSNKRICWLVQRESFSEDINSLSKKNVCSSRIQRLSPFMDDEGLLRVGGRLKHSELPYSAKHQIILPKDHFVVNLIIDYHHRIFLHCGPTQLQAVLREKYWILSARSIIRSRIFKRLRCFRMKPKPNTPLMGDLPSPRVVATRPFNVTGVDYAGPFTVKLYVLKRLQPIKVYLCLFVCFATKAVHLEVVSDLSSEAYIAALTRFISRRGSVKEIHSDCGTNFVGAAAALHKCFNNLLCNPVTHRFAEENNISFKFLPPHAPHQGGLWERAVRSAKHHLHRVIGGQILTYEEFITLVSRVEAILNSRPLTPLSGDPNDLESLTPGHFLTGGPLKSMVEPQYDETSCNRLRRWQLVQAFSQHIWTRWSQEYLHTLQHHSKWTSKTENLKIGDLVVIHEPNTPPLQWKLARITAVSPGADGIVRVVHLRTATGNFSRPTVKVSLLPTN
ncbi:uncharacterized protein LOC128982054, partial [Macrosteles quadrilineatus]